LDEIGEILVEELAGEVRRERGFHAPQAAEST
jgi:hypothetical protein